MTDETREASAESLIRRLWQFCNVLRDDGLSYPDYVEQLTYLLFLKMAEEEGNSQVPDRFSWSNLRSVAPGEMKRRYSETLRGLAGEPGLLGLIFDDARNKISDPAKLRLLVDQLIDSIEWSALSADVKGDAYEGLLEKNARDTKSGAGQYFTPRPLVEAMVTCIDPSPGEVVCDPACGTGGFLLAAHSHMLARVSKRAKKARELLKGDAFVGHELVREVARLAGMNLYLHGITGSSSGYIPIHRQDSLQSEPTRQVDVVLTNPPFGIRGSITYIGANGRKVRSTEELTVVRQDFRVRTSNKQLNFLQHIISLLKPGGRAAVIIPDNVLDDGGAARLVRRRLLEECTVRAILRLPTGLFYAQGIKASVLFFSKGRPDSMADRGIWGYDLRAGNRFSLKSRPIASADLSDFVFRFCNTPEGSMDRHYESAQWRLHSELEIFARGGDLDGFLMANPSETSGSPRARISELAAGITGDLTAALDLVNRATKGL